MQASRERMFQIAKAQGTISAGCVLCALGWDSLSKAKSGPRWKATSLGLIGRGNKDGLRNMSLSHQEVINYIQCTGLVHQGTTSFSLEKFPALMVKYISKCWFSNR